MRLVLRATILCVMLLTPAAAQTLGDLQDEIRDNLAQAHFASAFAGITLVSNELELNAGNFQFDNDSDMRVQALGLPYRTVLHPWGEHATGLYLEGVLGYGRAKESVADIYQGLLPGFETGVDSTWTTLGGQLGIGPQFTLAEDLSLAVIASAGLAHISNDSSYSGPGTALTAALLDGIALNWDGTTGSLGGALRLDGKQHFAGELQLEYVGRFDAAWSSTLEDDDYAQDFTELTQVLTLRSDLTGPTGWSHEGLSIGWRGTLGYRRFLEGQFIDVDELFQVGGGLDLALPSTWPVEGRLTLQATAVLGEDLTGYTLGLGLSK